MPHMCAPRINYVKRFCAPLAIYTPTPEVYKKRMGRKKTPKPALYEPTFLLAWRKAKNFTQADIATGINPPVSISTIGRLEDGLHPYNQELLERIAAFLDISVAELEFIDPTDKAGSVRKLMADSPAFREGVSQLVAESMQPVYDYASALAK
jgi:transcriptional regulator with XRE-family HTH domain